MTKARKEGLGTKTNKEKHLSLMSSEAEREKSFFFSSFIEVKFTNKIKCTMWRFDNWTHSNKEHKSGYWSLESGGDRESLAKGHRLSVTRWIRASV